MDKPALTLPQAAPPGSEGQTLLFSPEIELLIVAEESKGVYTAQRFREKHPEKYAAVIELSARSWGQLRIAKLLGCHHRTVAAVQLDEPEQIDIARSKMANALRQAAWLQLERLLEHPDTVPMNVSGLILSQLLDKAELLDGRATQRIEHIERIDQFGDWPAFVEENLQSEKLADAREIPSERIGSGAGNFPAIEDRSTVPVIVQAPGSEPVTDSLSEASHAPSQESTPRATDPTTDPAQSRRGQAGEEGVQDFDGGGQAGDLSERSEKF